MSVGDTLDAREAALLVQSLERMSREQPFRDIVRLFASRKDMKLPIEPLETALHGELFYRVKRDAGL